MLLNTVERALMNNPVRRQIQRRFEVRRLVEMGGTTPGARALEIGCGQGHGISLVLDTFGAATVDGFDLDPAMVALAERRHAQDPRVRLWTGDVERIREADATYDAVFDFGIVHHVPNWRAALTEVRRVLKPGGRFFAEEVLAAYILHPVWRRILDHPLEGRFDADTWCSGLEEAGFTVRERRVMGSWFVWTVADG